MRTVLLILTMLFTLGIFAYAQIPSMDEFNPDFADRLLAAQKTKPRFGDKKNIWSLFYFADIHSEKEEFNRIMEFYTKYEKYFDDVYCGGDFLADNLEDDFTFWDTAPNHEKILMCIGNHEVKKNKNSKYKVDQATEKETYDKFFAPYIKNWNCTYQEGHTYYYKDYDNKKIRLITLDSMIMGKDCEAQYKWFYETLKGALEKQYSVVVSNHSTMNMNQKDIVHIKCNFTQPVDFFTTNSMAEEHLIAVDQFINSGGDFVCWLGGHIHADCIFTLKNHPKQLNVYLDASSLVQCEYFSDVMRTKGTKNQDLAQAFIVNTTEHQIKIIRAGASINTYLQPRNNLVLDYKTFEVITEN